MSETSNGKSSTVGRNTGHPNGQQLLWDNFRAMPRRSEFRSKNSVPMNDKDLKYQQGKILDAATKYRSGR
jgi:hypothetical protein